MGATVALTLTETEPVKTTPGLAPGSTALGSTEAGGLSLGGVGRDAVVSEGWGEFDTTPDGFPRDVEVGLTLNASRPGSPACGTSESSLGGNMLGEP